MAYDYIISPKFNILVIGFSFQQTPLNLERKEKFCKGSEYGYKMEIFPLKFKIYLDWSCL